MLSPEITTQLFADLQAERTRAADALDGFSLRGFKDVITDLTQGDAHFVYELLQNADDAKAHDIRFRLMPEGLAVWHNAPEKFTLSDVATEQQDVGTSRLGHLNAITSVGQSTKRRTDNPAGADTIGRFGIGFKSVFQYTATPHVYEEDFSFRLRRILVPERLADEQDLPAGVSRGDAAWTLLWLPFNHAERADAVAYEHVLRRLSGLRLPLLFLRHLTSINWEAQPAGEPKPTYTGCYLREPARLLKRFPGDIFSEYVELAQENTAPAPPIVATAAVEVPAPTKGSKGVVPSLRSADAQASQRFIVVKQPCQEHPALSVCLAFPLRDDGSLDPTVEDRGYEAFCYFSTRHHTGLRFLIQAPWLLTNNREAIKAEQPWNKQLVSQLAKLLADSLPLLGSLAPQPRPGVTSAPSTSLLTDELLQLLPLRESWYDEQRLADDLDRRRELSFRPFHEAVFEAMRQKPLLPTSNGGHVKAANAYFAESQALSRVFGTEQLRLLVGNNEAEWVFDSISGKADKAQTEYIGRLLDSNHLLEPKEVATRLTKAFMEAQSDEWLTIFYTYLDAGRGPTYLLDGQNDAVLRHRGDILRLEDGTHAAAYASAKSTVPQVFLPPSVGSGLLPGTRTFKAVFAQDENLAGFRRRLGLTEPTQLTVLTDYILPLYQQPKDIALATHLDHLKQLLACWRSSAPAEQEVLRDKLKELTWVRGIGYPNADALPTWYRPVDLYVATNDLRNHFSASETIFVNEEAYQGLQPAEIVTLRELWGQTGMWFRLKTILYNETPIETDNKYWRELGRYNRPSEQLLENHNLAGLAELFEDSRPVTPVVSESLFRLLCQYLAIDDRLPFERQYTFYHRREKWGPYVTDSYALETLRKYAWLFDQNRQVHCPHEFATGELALAPDYDLTLPGAQQLLALFSIPSNYQKALDGLLPSEQEFLQLLRRKRATGLSDDQLKAWITQLNPTIVPKEPTHPPSPISTADQDRRDALKGERDAADSHAGNGIPTPPEVAEEPVTSPSADIDDEEAADPNELSQAAQQKLRRAQQKLEELEDELRNQDELAKKADAAGIYTYAWFKALLDLEIILSNRKDEKASEFSISFGRVEPDPHSPHLLVLREPTGNIPRNVEDHPDLKLRLYLRGNQPPRTLKIDVVSVKDFTLRAKMSAADLASIDPAQVQRASIQVQSPAFLLDELVKQFNGLASKPYSFSPEHNLQTSLPQNLRFIFGPPGTGKTYHLAHHEIERLMALPEPVRILVLTPTNKAADVLTARLLPPPADTSLPPLRPDWLIRYGSTADSALEAVPNLVRDAHVQIEEMERCAVLTTAARFPYATCNGGSMRLADIHWDYIILDEASMIPLYQAVNIIYQKPTCREFIIGGDPLQIPPVVYAEPWAGQNIYSLVGLQDFENPATIPHPFKVERLLTQRRATPPLGRLFSQYAYGGLLQHARPLTGNNIAIDGSLYEGRRPESFGDLALGDITVIHFPVRRGEGIFEARKLEQGSNFHAYSALLTAELARYLAAQVTPVPGPDGAAAFRVGIITPYTAQASLTRELIKQMPLTHAILNPNEDIGTVHGFQGDECNLVIALLSPPPTTGDRIMLNHRHILNVAVSRARDRLILLVPEYDDARATGAGLAQLNNLLRILDTESEGEVVHLSASEVEETLFGVGAADFILSNSFATSHQLVNVYGQGIARYELRFGSTAVDVQVNLKAPKADSSKPNAEM